MALSLKDQGECLAIGAFLQQEVNQIEKKRQEIQNLMKSTLRIASENPIDELGEPYTKLQLQENLKKVRMVFAKQFPKADLSKSTLDES